MTYEFDGRTEKEAIDKAAEELGLQKDDFDVEILETQRSGLFKKGFVRIRVHTGQEPEAEAETEAEVEAGKKSGSPAAPVKNAREELYRGAVFGEPDPRNDFERDMLFFIETVMAKMGCPGKASVLFRKGKKMGIKIDSESSSLLIGKKGKNLDALQLLANVYAGRLGQSDEARIILDSENYRSRREDALVRLAHTSADKVRGSRGTLLLEPMNPFDRRLIHTALAGLPDIETISEGEGVYKQVRVYYRGGK